MKLGNKWFVFIILVSVSCTPLSTDSRQAELQTAFEHSQILATIAHRTFDTSQLSEAFTQNAIDIIEKEQAVEKQLIQSENLTIIGGEEVVKVDWVDIIKYTPPEAIIEVKYFYRSYTYNLETGEVIYYDEPYRYWRIFRYRMRQENGVWKVDEALEFVDWSG